MRPALPSHDKAAPLLFRPEPVLAIGIAAGRGPDWRGGEIASVAEAAQAVLASLRRECTRIAEREAELFGPGPARLRVVTRLSGSMDLALAEAAQSEGAEVQAITLEAAGLPEPSRPGAGGFARLRLPGGPGDPRSEARTGDALLAASDLLLAAWDGRPDASPGSTGALVQEALERRIPVLLLPTEADGDAEIVDDPGASLLPAVAAELPRVRLVDNLDHVLARVFAPPRGREERDALRTFLAEPETPHTFRPEYRALLLLSERRPHEPVEPVLGSRDEWRRAETSAALVSPAVEKALALQAARHARIEELAAFHGERVRSGVVLRYSGPAFGSLAIALLAIAFPQWSLAWLGVQAVVMTTTITEATLALRGRWSERWLDYRSLAERLRCDRFLFPYGIGLGRLETETEAEDPAWMRWCHRRLSRERWPVGEVSQEVVQAAFRQLLEVEIAGQIRYHEGAARRYRSLDRRLRLISTGAVLCLIGATFALFGLTLTRSSPPLVQGLVTLLLITLPSVFLAARGLRLEGAFALAAARSEQALHALKQLRDKIPAAPLTYDRLVQASRAAAAAMIGDTADWRVGLQRSRTPYRNPED